MTAASGFPPEPSDRIVVLLNPHASGGNQTALRRRIAGALGEYDVPFDLVETASASEAMTVARRAAREGYRAVAAAGGDGTVAAALRGTAGTDVPVAILPFGTGNQLATNFGIPESLEGSVRVAVEGESEPIDLGWIDGQYFALMSGAGADADMMAEATTELKQRLGPMAYLYAALKNAISPRVADYRIRADDEELEVRASMVILANVGLLSAPPFPLELQIGPRISVQDGLLDICIFAPRNLPEAAGMLWKVARREYQGDDRMIFLQASEVEVECEPPLPVQVDGEAFGHTPLRAEVRPSAGRILFPRRESG